MNTVVTSLCLRSVYGSEGASTLLINCKPLYNNCFPWGDKILHSVDEKPIKHRTVFLILLNKERTKYPVITTDGLTGKIDK